MVSSDTALNKSVSFFLFFEERRKGIEDRMKIGFSPFGEIDGSACLDKQAITNSIKLIKKSSLNCLQVIILRVINFVVKFFKSEFKAIDELLEANYSAKLLQRKYSEILYSSTTVYTSQVKDKKVNPCVQSSLNLLQEGHLNELKTQLASFHAKAKIEGATAESILTDFNNLPKSIRQLMNRVVEERYEESVEKNPLLLLEKEESGTSPIEEVTKVIQLNANAYGKLNASEDAEDQERLLADIEKNDRILSGGGHARDVIYDVSCESVLEDISEDTLKMPITVTMVGVEYAGLVKQGGLAEALEGLSRGIKEQNPLNRVKLIFPKYSHLPISIQRQLNKPVVYSGSHEEFNVYRFDIDGIECYFIEDPSFVLAAEKPDIYGPDMQVQAKRFARFSELAAELIWEQNDTDVIHLHDWHVSGVGLKLKQDHPEEWKNGKISPILFTFHNNNRSAQGRIHLGPYNYDPIVKGYVESGITRKNDNLFVSILMTADAITTVSENFGLEAQQEKYGEEVSFAVRQAAKVGKLVGIINGTNTDRWDPKTDPQLVAWKDISTGEPMSLAFGADDEDILTKKSIARKQLQLWTQKYMPEAKIDFSKPLVTYIGRLDSYQKGLDKFEEAIKATLKNGGQFIVMGMGEDPEAARILDRLESLYKEGVLFVRDYKDPDGRIHFQQGDKDRPGMGCLVRTVSDFVFLPSRFEPCGLVQFEGWLFGSLAIGSNTGGLADTIISPDVDSEVFNGFLFKRDEKSVNSVSAVIEKALHFWIEQTETSKKEIMTRLMTEGKKYGWHSSPRGFTPAEKYRFSYENAKRWAGMRSGHASSYYKADAIAREIIIDPSERKGPKPEEEYMQLYYKGRLDSAALYSSYKKIPKVRRDGVPSPYGVNVNFTKYEEYGAFCRGGATIFRVYAPHAPSVRIRLYDEAEELLCEAPMIKNSSGEWETSFEALPAGQRYHYIVDGKVKIDPFSRSFIPSASEDKAPYSVVSKSSFEWSDDSWSLQRIDDPGKFMPMSIFEFHLTTWKRKEDGCLNYRELARELVKHCKKGGYTHVEPMGILEHFYEASWGYQVSGYFAPNSRLGSVDDFKFMVNHLHINGIGIIMDWVPAHFAINDFGLKSFDGSSLFEATGLRYNLSVRKWFFSYGSKHFDFSKKYVREFLISSAAFWLKEMHIDGLRVDCVRSMLNSENQQSANLFMRDFNAVIHENFERAVTIAEEYSGDTSVTKSVWLNGLGFDMKWHVGLMKGALGFFKTPPKNRSKRYQDLKVAIQSDNFHKQVMALSHDDFSTSGLIALTPGLSGAEKLANLKAILSFFMCLPGKKLFFMGSDTGSEKSWTETFATHDPFSDHTLEKEEVLNMMARLNDLYRTHPAMSEFDRNGHDLEWIEDPAGKIHAYRRKSSAVENCVCLHNFTHKERVLKVVCFPDKAIVPEVVFNSDDMEFGGEGRVNLKLDVDSSIRDCSYFVTVPPLATVIVQETSEEE